MDKIEEYLKYRWEHWKNYVFSDEYENIWCQIPEYTLDSIKFKLIFNNFLSQHYY